MKLYLKGHGERYAIEQLQLALFPEEPMEPMDAPFAGDGAVSSLSIGEKWLTATATITLGGKTAKVTRRLSVRENDVPSRRRLLQNTYYEAAMQFIAPPKWGSLSGVRPTKLTTRHLLAGGDEKSAEKLMRQRYFVSEERIRLALECSRASVRAVEQLRENDICLYVGIPFCPTRCSYCSFVSGDIARCAHLLKPYLAALKEEISYVGKLVKESGKKIRALYIGGGTPTTLSPKQLKELMEEISRHFDLTELIEYTIEGGRPDTLNYEKLRTLKELGCDRMSINPQTMNDKVLETVGRKHTSRQTLKAYEAAIQAGFTGINMDLIAGLPGDTAESFAESLKQVVALDPSNITVHTLAIKKGADLYFDREALPSAEAVAEMLRFTEETLRAAGYTPYYLYRQKYMSGSFENVGWCKPGFEGWYNIYMMEELCSIVSLGGGGMTKINLPGGRLERFHNPKFPQQYLEKQEEIIKQKQDAFALMNCP